MYPNTILVRPVTYRAAKFIVVTDKLSRFASNTLRGKNEKNTYVLGALVMAIGIALTILAAVALIYEGLGNGQMGGWWIAGVLLSILVACLGRFINQTATRHRAALYAMQRVNGEYRHDILSDTSNAYRALMTPDLEEALEQSRDPKVRAVLRQYVAVINEGMQELDRRYEYSERGLPDWAQNLSIFSYLYERERLFNLQAQHVAKELEPLLDISLLPELESRHVAIEAEYRRQLQETKGEFKREIQDKWNKLYRRAQQLLLR